MSHESSKTELGNLREKKSTKRKTDEHKNAKTKQPHGYIQKQRNARNEPSSYPSVTASVYLRQGR